jgi:glycosyltransferase involved in cell wall biosynthesis
MILSGGYMSKKNATNSKKRICIVAQNPMAKGGIATVVRGYRGSDLEKYYEITYIESYIDGSRKKKLLKAVKSYFLYISLLLRHKPDLVHIHSAFGPSFYRKLPFILLSALFHVPIINHIHGSEFKSFYLDACKTKKTLIRKAYNACSILIVLSNGWKEILSQVVPTEKIRVIENYCLIPEQVKREECRKQVLFLGMIGKGKGCYDIPEVVEMVTREIPNCHFVLAGDGEIEAICQLLQEKHVEEYVLFPGWLRGKGKDRVLRESDIFLLPSYSEGMPMSILEAMGYGLPIVSTDVGAIPKLVQNEVNGFTFKPGDKYGFANSIIALLMSKEMRLRYGDNSRNIVINEYSLESHIQKINEVYKLTFKG